MKKIHIALVLILCFFCTGCGVMLSSRKLADVRVGMTPRQVKDVLGVFDYRRFNGDMEEWEFHRYINAEQSVIIIQFIDGKVASMDTFSQVAPLPPAVVAPVSVHTTAPSSEDD